MTYDAFKTLCESRRSIRYFDDQPVTTAEVLSLLELARMAPSVENLQPWHFHVIFNHDLQKRLMEASCYGNFVEGAGAFIVVTVEKSLANSAKEPVWNPRELEYSCMGAMTHIILGATAMGLGSCWVSLHHGAAFEALGLPARETVVGGIMLGRYRKGEKQPSDGHQRKALRDIVTMHD